jgi:outer membrane translocation and assembly module TamA
MGAVFFDAGTVQPERRDIVLGDLKTDYGIGIRWGGPFGVFFRTDFAIGGDSGTRFLLRFNNAF